ncbi:hypothetical protein EMGBS15_17700 [Filimonas sp.]|nr:hypothetical protein EMGBS15_17700 [Filimonas sp.]
MMVVFVKTEYPYLIMSVKINLTATIERNSLLEKVVRTHKIGSLSWRRIRFSS